MAARDMRVADDVLRRVAFCATVGVAPARTDVAARDAETEPLRRAAVVGVVAVRIARFVVVAVRAVAVRAGTDTTDDGVLVVRGKTFDVVRADTDLVPVSTVLRMPTSRTTTPVRADVVPRSRTDTDWVVFWPDAVLREIPDVAFVRVAVVVVSPRFDATVVDALRRVAARAVSVSSAFATWKPINPRHTIKNNFNPFIPLVLSLANF